MSDHSDTGHCADCGTVTTNTASGAPWCPTCSTVVAVEAPENGQRRGTTLCERHALQASGLGVAPDGPCAPLATWLDGAGQPVSCDVLIAPERVAAYLASQPPAGSGSNYRQHRLASERRLRAMDETGAARG